MRYEYASQRSIRERNKRWYRVAHWPIWIWVFFLAPGPLTFDLFEHGPGWRNMAWLLVVLVGTGIAGLYGQLPGVEPRPYILRFTEDKPNPLYRRVCYTFAWSDVITFALLNLTGLVLAVFTGAWYLKADLRLRLLSLIPCDPSLGRAGNPPARPFFHKRGGHRAPLLLWICLGGDSGSQALLMVLWKAFPRSQTGDIVKLVVYVVSLVLLGMSARLGLSSGPSCPSVPGELMVAD